MKKILALSLALSMTMSAMPAMAEGTGSTGENAITTYFETDFSTNPTTVFSGDTGVTQAEDNGALKLTATTQNNNYAGKSLGQTLSNDLIRISYKMKKGNDNTYTRIKLNGSATGKHVLTFLNANHDSGTYFVEKGNDYTYLFKPGTTTTDKKKYPLPDINSRFVELALEFDLKDGTVAVYEDGVAVEYYSNMSRLDTSKKNVKSVETNIKSITDVGFTVGLITGTSDSEASIYLDDVSVVSGVDYINKEIEDVLALNQNALTTEEIVNIRTLSDKVTYYQGKGYTFEKVDELESLKNSVKVLTYFAADFSNADDKDLFTKATGSESSTVEIVDGALKFGTDTAKYSISRTLDTTLDNDLFRINYKMKRGTTNTYTRILLNDTEMVTFLNNGNSSGTYFYQSPTYIYLRKQGAGTHSTADGVFVDLSLEFDLKNETLKIYEDGVPVEYFTDNARANNQNVKRVTSAVKNISSIGFSVGGVNGAGSVFVDDISIVSGVDYINNQIAELVELGKTGLSAEKISEAKLLYENVLYYQTVGYTFEGVEDLAKLTEDAVTTYFASDFSSDADLNKFNNVDTADTTLTKTLDNGTMKLTSDATTRKVMANIGQTLQNDLVRVTYKIKTSDDNAKTTMRLWDGSEEKDGIIFLNTSNSSGTYYFGYGASQSWMLKPGTSSSNLGTHPIPDIKERLVEITMELDLKNKTAKMYEDGVAVEYYTNQARTALDDVSRITLNATKFSALGIGVGSASTEASVWLDDISVVSGVDYINKEIKNLISLDKENLTDEQKVKINSLYENVIYYQSVGYSFENVAELEAMKEATKPQFVEADFTDESGLAKFTITDETNIEAKVEDGKLKLTNKGNSSLAYGLKYDLVNPVDEGLVVASFKLNKPSDPKTHFKMMVNGTTAEDNAILIAANENEAGTFMAYGALDSAATNDYDKNGYVNLGNSSTGYVPCDNKETEVTIEYDFNNKRFKVYENGVECNYYKRDMETEWNNGEYATMKFDKIEYVVFSLMNAANGSQSTTVTVDDIKIISGEDYINNLVAGLDSTVTEDNVAKISADIARVEYYINNGYGSILIAENTTKLSTLKSSVEAIIKVSFNANKETAIITGLEGEAIVLAATYNNGKLVAVTKETVTLEKAGTEVDIAGLSYEGSDTVKIMVWNSLESMKPLCSGCSVSVDQ